MASSHTRTMVLSKAECFFHLGSQHQACHVDVRGWPRGSMWLILRMCQEGRWRVHIFHFFIRCLFGLDPISRTAGNEASQGLRGPPAAGDFSVPAACDSAGPWKPLSRSACQGWSGPFVMLIMDIVALVLHNRVYATPSATLKLHWSQRICIILHLHSTCGLPNFLNVSNAMSSTTSTLFLGCPCDFEAPVPPKKKVTEFRHPDWS